MEYVFSIMMMIFGGMLLLYAGMVAASKSTELIPRDYAAKMRDKKLYAKQFSKLLALIALPFIISGLVGLTLIYWLAVVVFVVAMVFAIIQGGKIMKKA